MYCMRCGTENKADARFCSGCGRLLPLPGVRKKNPATSSTGAPFHPTDTMRRVTAESVGSGSQKNGAGGTTMTILGIILFVFSGLFLKGFAVSQTTATRMRESDSVFLILLLAGIVVGIALTVIGIVRLAGRGGK